MNHYEKAIRNLGWTEITMWFRAGEYNHFEFGHCVNETPTPKVEAHKQLWKGKWSKRYWWATQGEVLRFL
jgi:hypothetical protein